jgi:hypothetical protein
MWKNFDQFFWWFIFSCNLYPFFLFLHQSVFVLINRKIKCYFLFWQTLLFYFPLSGESCVPTYEVHFQSTRMTWISSATLQGEVAQIKYHLKPPPCQLIGWSRPASRPALLTYPHSGIMLIRSFIAIQKRVNDAYCTATRHWSGWRVKTLLRH